MYDNDILQFLLSAFDLGMINGDFVIIALDAQKGSLTLEGFLHIVQTGLRKRCVSRPLQGCLLSF